ncbi:MAG: efflux RND transporter periplasmic adaptor subunit [Candidatus Coatesbacteria bacterium]|nr:efflux RND transporter periplasmic adaptor subunit [Candidatus Coatesbacteria bacterium]
MTAEKAYKKQYEPSERGAPQVSTARKWASYISRFGLAIIILLVAGLIAAYWMSNKPKAQRTQPPKQSILVEVAPIKLGEHQVVVEAMGTVIPAKEVQLTSRVGGEVVEVAPEFVPGGQFRRGEKVLKIDPRDYELVLKQRKSELAKAESELKLEMGQQSISQKEYKLLGQEVESGDEELLLRKPQLESARAAVASAEAAYEKAALDLNRTTVEAPFNSQIQSTSVEVGAQVSAGAALGSIAGTDEYWVKVSVPVDQLKWIDIPGNGNTTGSTVRILYVTQSGETDAWNGKVMRLMPSLETQGRLAQILVNVEDPLGLSDPATKRRPLLLDSYVRAEIIGRQLDNVAAIDRTSLRDGNHVWVMLPDDTLDIREVEIAWGSDELVCVSGGLRDGELLVISDIAAPVKRTSLRTGNGSSRKSKNQPSVSQQGS